MKTEKISTKPIREEEYPLKLVRFVARIAKNQEIRIDPRQRTTRSKSPNTSRSPSMGASIQSTARIQNKNLNPDLKYSVFTTRNPSNIVLATETPITGKLLNSALLSIEDLPYFNSTMNSSPFTFSFDGAYDECTTQEKFYNANVRQLVKGLLVGRSGTMICFGPSGSGKTYTLKGKQGADRGSTLRAVEEIFNMIDLAKEGKSPNSANIEVCLSIYAIYNNKLFDLLEHSNTNLKPLELITDSLSKPSIKNLAQHTLKGTYDCQSYFQRAEKTKKILAVEEQDPDFNSRAHQIVLLTLYKPAKNDRKILSKAQFIELANSEQAVDKTKPKIAKSLAANFNAISVKILNHALMKDKHSHDKLVKCAEISMEPSASVLFCCCAAPSIEKLKHTLPALKFSSKIMECIDGKLSFHEQSKPLGDIEENLEMNQSYKPKSSENYPQINVVPPEIQSTPTLKNEQKDVEELHKSLSKVRAEIQELENEKIQTARPYNQSTIARGYQPALNTEKLRRNRTEFYTEHENSQESYRKLPIETETYRKSPIKNNYYPATKVQKPWKTVYEDRELSDSPSRKGYETNKNEERMSFAERKNIEQENVKHSMTLSKDAENIVKKYSRMTTGEIAPQEENEENVNNNVSPQKMSIDYEEKLNSIEQRSKSIAKTLKRLTTETSNFTPNSAISQQYENLFAETKAIYGKMIDNLTLRNAELEAKLASHRDEIYKKDLDLSAAKKLASKSAETKENEIEELRAKLAEYEENAKRMASEMEETHNLNRSAIRKLDDLNANHELILKEAEMKYKNENDLLKDQVAEMKAKLKEKNETLVKQQNIHNNDNKEIAELKYKLASEQKSVEDGQAEIHKLQKKLEEIQAKYIEADKKAEKTHKKLNKIKEEHDEKTKIGDEIKENNKKLQENLEQADQKIEQLSKEISLMINDKENIIKERDENIAKNKNLQSEINLLHEQIEELNNEISNTQTENQKKVTNMDTNIQELELKIKQKDLKITELESKMNDLEINNKNQINEIEKKSALIIELQKIIEDSKKSNVQLTEENAKLVNELETANNENEAKLNELEKACDLISEECNTMKIEKANTKLKLSELEEKNNSLIQEKEKYETKYKNVKKLNKMLKEKLEDIENEVTLYAKEREMEIKESLREKAIKKTTEHSKLAILQEVQNQISQYKNEQRRRKSPQKSPMDSYRKSPYS